MKVRGRNGKWLGARNGGTIGIGWVNVVCQFGPRIPHVRRSMDAFIVVNIVECCAEVGHHECVGSENRGRNRRGPVNGKEGADCGELVVDFFFLNVEELHDVHDHLFMRESQIAVGGAVWRRRGNKVGGVASTLDGRRRAGGNENGRR